MSYAEDAFKSALRGPFSGLAQASARAHIDAVTSGGLIGEDAPQHAGLWAALASIWAADWRAMTREAARITETVKGDGDAHQDMDAVLTAVRTGMVEVISRVEDTNKAIAQLPSAVLASTPLTPHVTPPEPLDFDRIGRAVAVHVQPNLSVNVHQHYDVVDSLKKAAKDGFSVFWAFVGSVVCAALMGLLVHVYVKDSRDITALQNQNAMLVQKIKDAQAGHPIKNTRSFE